ncbi:hypothetical protein [Kingella potus]|uniref:hypothetical protein n=1 Tax=Kingella potus TaxID=265175 RepID=UPI001FD19DC2|nr:hypothetical protein [Kingella potus]UOP00529.1 hypothetical protein LVJ84_11910 [Kingella potus]UOP02024.1 hypothetical protein LVJ84_14315 [Kingella potus]
MSALAEPQINIGWDGVAGLIEEWKNALERRDAKVADAAAAVLIEKLKDGLRRMV